jgi:ABC-2 type transport system permease protein
VISVGTETKSIAILTFRNVLKSFRTPMLITFSLVQPMIWLVMFSQTFRGLADTQEFSNLGFHSYLTFFVPGMIVLSVLFTSLQSGMATITDIDTGVFDKLLISPVRRSSILLGRVVADSITMVVQAALVLALALAMGAGVHDGWGGALGFLGFAVLFGIVWASLSNLIALRTRNSELTMVVGLFVTLPTLFLSSAFFPTQLLPGWLRGVANVNPAAYVIQTGQQLLNTGNNWGQDLRTLTAIVIAGIIFISATVTAFRASTT